MLEKYGNKIKIVFKNYPLPMHPFARQAAVAAQAAFRQGKFKEFHHRLFSQQNSLSQEMIRRLAQDLGLNMETFDRDMNDPAIQAIIMRDMKEGQEAGVPGTPTVFVNGKLVQRDIEAVIDADLKKKGRK